MNPGDLVWMPRHEGDTPPVESEFACGLVLSHPRPREEKAWSRGRVKVLWTEADGSSSVDWEPHEWLERIQEDVSQVGG